MFGQMENMSNILQLINWENKQYIRVITAAELTVYTADTIQFKDSNSMCFNDFRAV